MEELKLPFTVKTAGHELSLKCVGLKSQCGKITNGIAFEFGRQGSWIVDWKDLEKIVKAAEKVRSTK